MSVSQISELRKRSNQFVANLQVYIGDVIDHNERLLQLNKAQLKSSKTSKGGPLVNSKTGSPYYTAPYARKKGYRSPDLFVSGDFYKQMDILFKEPNEYDIVDYAKVTKYLVEMYTNEIFGIQDKKKAQKIVVLQLRALFVKKVL